MFDGKKTCGLNMLRKPTRHAEEQADPLFARLGKPANYPQVAVGWEILLPPRFPEQSAHNPIVFLR